METSFLNDCTNKLSQCIIFSTLFIIIIIGTIFGNAFVIATIYLERNLHNHGNYLILSLAITDLLVATLVMPIAAYREVLPSWHLPALFCDIWTSLDVLCCTASILHLLAIACDRYFYLTKISYKRERKRIHTFNIVFLVWLISISISAFPHVFGLHSEQCQITKNLIFQFISTLVAFYFPLILMCIIYWKIYQLIKRTIRKKRFIIPSNKASRTIALEKSAILLKKSVSEAMLVKNLEVKEEMGVKAKSLDIRNELEHSFNQFTKIVRSRTSIDSIEKHSSQLIKRSTSCSAYVRKHNFASFLFHTVSDHKLNNISFTKLDVSMRKLSSIKSKAIKTNKEDTQPLERIPCRNLSNLVYNDQRTQCFYIDEKSSFRRSSFIDAAEEFFRAKQRSRCKDSKESRRHSKHERKAARTLGIVISCFILCWLPFFLMQMVFAFCPSCPDYMSQLPLLGTFLTWLGYSNSLINPIVYTIFSPDFREAFEKILFKRLGVKTS